MTVILHPNTTIYDYINDDVISVKKFEKLQINELSILDQIVLF